VDGDLAQSWHLRLVRTAADGSVNVEEVLVDEQGRAAVRLEQDQSGVLVVAATTPHTTEPARYTVLVE
jgi:hypothetical protein